MRRGSLDAKAVSQRSLCTKESVVTSVQWPTPWGIERCTVRPGRELQLSAGQTATVTATAMH